MPSTIKFRRGSTAPPTLAAGEPAFVIADKSLYIGDGIANYRIGPNNANILTNGNFQLYNTMEEVVYLQPTIPNYVGGLYRCTCTGSSFLTARFPTTNQDGTINLEGDGTQKVKIEYTIPYDTGWIVSRPYEGQPLVLSFDLESTKAGTFNYGVSGGTTYAKSYTTGRQRLVCPIPSWNDASLYANHFNLLIADFNEPIANNTKFGNVKLERGTVATPFVANSLTEDAARLAESYVRIVGTYRATTYDANTFYFSIPYNFKPNLLNVRKLTLNSCELRNFGTGTSTGFTYSLHNPTATEITIKASKNAHGLTDLSAYVDIIIDYRK